MNKQINISEIENGYLIAVQGNPPSAINPQGTAGKVIFCESLPAVKNMLDKIFSEVE